MHGLMPTTTTILLVAASELRRKILAQQLEVLGFSVIAIADSRALTNVLNLTKYDLLVADLSGEETAQTRALAEQAASLLAQGIPILTLTSDQQADPEAWTQEALGYRVAAALRNRNTPDVLTERAARWEGLNVLDPETLLFSRRYFEAIFAIEIERSKRVHQPMALLMIQLNATQPISADLWHMLSARLLTSLRQTDILVRYTDTIVLVLLPVTEAAFARAVATRLLKSLGMAAAGEAEPPHITIGLATYPQHGTTPDTLLSAARKALSHAGVAGMIISFDQI